jgi:FkbM family methyltransferase
MAKSDFRRALGKKISRSQFNNFGIENFDELRFGGHNVPATLQRSAIFLIKQFIKKIIYYNNRIDVDRIDWLNKYLPSLERSYDLLDNNGRDLIIDLLAYRCLGYKNVKLKRNNSEYWQAIDLSNSLAHSEETYDPHFKHFILEKLDLGPVGYPVKLYFNRIGVVTSFILEQYAYKRGGETLVEAENGDVVLDAGACWGDTALYFAHKVGSGGKVYSFEFIPGNLHLFNINRLLNPNLANQIELVEHPVSNRADNTVYYKDHGPGSRIEFQPFEGQTGSTTTITIDAFIRANNIAKIDFIKMDIEGAELSALEGAIETIKEHRPKLAIAIYHSMNDFARIPGWISDLNLGYELFIDHYTIHAEETVCFARAKVR